MTGQRQKWIGPVLLTALSFMLAGLLWFAAGAVFERPLIKEAAAEAIE
jgi:hypothetical protein